MFMFWGKRTSYTKRLLKAKVRGEHETECEAQENYFVPNKLSASGFCSESVSSSAVNVTSVRSNNTAEEPDEARTSRCKELLKSLKENQLEMLLAAVESYGANLGPCVLVKRRRRSGTRSSSLGEAENRHKAAAESLQVYRGHRHNNNHNRRQRGSPRDEGEEDDVDEKRRKGQEDDNAIILDDRTTASTTTARLCRSDRNRSRNPGDAGSELPVDPHLLCCQFWRWPDLLSTSELKRLPVCHSAKDPVDVCCNPYHWSRLCKPESPPPPYCLIADRLRPEDRAPSEGDVLHRCNRNTNSPPLPGSLTTNGDDASGQREWCTLAYWELGGRVGRLYPVEPSSVNVFDSLLDGDGLCLATLAENHSTSPAIQRTRSKIGLGLTLSQESDGVWAYNRSDNPIFVNSPTLDDPESRTLLVYRVPPGFCLNIFDRAKTLIGQYQSSSTSSSLGVCCQSLNGANTNGIATSGPVDVNSVRISFAKGWGPKYSRQEVTSCPCWLEVLLAPCR